MCSGPCYPCNHRRCVFHMVSEHPRNRSKWTAEHTNRAGKSLRNMPWWVSRSVGSWHVGYVKRSRPHVHSPRSPHHRQSISSAHFKRTAEHTNRNREPFGGFRGHEVDRSMPIEGVNPFHVGSRIKGRPLHRTLRGKRDHLQPISHVHFKRSAEHTKSRP